MIQSSHSMYIFYNGMMSEIMATTYKVDLTKCKN